MTKTITDLQIRLTIGFHYGDAEGSIGITFNPVFGGWAYTDCEMELEGYGETEGWTSLYDFASDDEISQLGGPVAAALDEASPDGNLPEFLANAVKNLIAKGPNGQVVSKHDEQFSSLVYGAASDVRNLTQSELAQEAVRLHIGVSRFTVNGKCSRPELLVQAVVARSGYIYKYGEDPVTQDAIASSPASQPAVTYRNESGETWSGRGLKPKWVRAYLAEGKELSELLVKP